MKLGTSQHISRRRFSLAVAGLILAVLFWAINAIVARGVVNQVPPMALSFYRWLTAFIFIFPFAYRGLKKDWPHIREHIGSLCILAIPSVGIYNSVLYLGAVYTTATNIALMAAAMPAMTLGFAWAINRNAPRLLQSLGIFISLIGVIVIIAKGSLNAFTDLNFNPGDLLILISIASWALYSVLLKKKTIPISPLSFLSMIIGLGLICILPFYLWEFFIGKGFEVNGAVIGVFIYLGVCPSILSYICWNNGVKTLGAPSASVFMYLIPVFTSVIAYYILGEHLFAYHFSGGGLILVGLLLSSRQSAVK